MLFNLQHPHDVLGPHEINGRVEIYLFAPKAERAFIISQGERTELEEVRDRLFKGALKRKVSGRDYIIEITGSSGYTRRFHDPYAFNVAISDQDLYLFKIGDLHLSYLTMGAHTMQVDGVAGTVFRVWAPNAAAVSVIGDFNGWQAGCTPMNNAQDSGIWELFVPDVGKESLYKFAIKSNVDGIVRLKTDPYASMLELRPRTASVVYDSEYSWNDSEWIAEGRRGDVDEALSIYEVHLGSWRKSDGTFSNYRDIAMELSGYVKDLGFNYVELLPVMEHPLDASWGYQVTNYYAPSSRYGTPDDFRFFIDHMHQNNIGVILDWVPAHFPADDFGLAQYDGTHLFEHDDPRLGKHPDWGTLIFNYSRNEVHNFLISNALYWIREFHADGLRIDAVSSMLYLDYSRKEGEWLPNKYGGNENLDAISFLRELNDLVHSDYPGVLTVAEESTAWPGVTRSTQAGGLGFDFKWNMGWMHDTLHYFSLDPVHRRYHQNDLSFSMWYAFNENFILPFSHDEVVHEKGSLYGKMPGDQWRKFANLRLCFAYMFSFPGKKLLFMGSEFAQEREWNHAGELDWYLSGRQENSSVYKLVRDLNRSYREMECMHEGDSSSSEFEWIDFSDSDNSVISFVRYSKDRKQFAVCVFNFTPVPRHGYRIGVPADGFYREIINTDSHHYNGSGQGNYGGISSEGIKSHGRDNSIAVTLPPLAAVIFARE